MVQVKEIVDEHSFRAWLDELPTQEQQYAAALILGTRAVTRVIPFWASAMPGEIDQRLRTTALPVAWIILIAGAALRQKNGLTTRAAVHAKRAINQSVYVPMSSGSNAAISAANDLAESVSATSLDSAIVSAEYSAVFAGCVAPHETMWDDLQSDVRYMEAGRDVLTLPLWSEDMPDDIAEAWARGRSWMQSAPGHAFWIRWYDAILAGQPLTQDWDSHWQLLHDIALIDPEDWGEGHEQDAIRVAGIIEGMLLKAALPTTDRLVQTDHGTYVVEPLPIENAQTFDTFLDLVGDRLEDCLLGHNGINERSREARTLQRVLAKYRDNPLRIEQDFTSVAAGLRKNFASEVLPESDDNRALLEGLEDTVRLIRDVHPAVAQTRNQIAHLRMQELEPNQKEMLADARELLVEVSEGQLRDDFDADLSDLIAPTLPGAMREDRGNDPPPEALRSFARIAKMYAREQEEPLPLSKRASELIKEIDASAGYKAVGMVTTGGALFGILGVLGRFALQIFGVL